jgi:hypothetical protein
MIAASVKLIEPLNHNRFINESPINQWLLDNIGPHAPSRDTVSEERPWYVDHGFRYLLYHFARERDATMFSLRWS